MDEKILIREYLSNLKEDKELDKIFVFLLESMGFEIISTPEESKGQSQFGKDIVAIGVDEKKVKHSWCFELKGHSDANIDSVNFNKEDGIRMSLLEAKDVSYQFLRTKGLDNLPRKIVLVHNGTVKENFKTQFQGFVEKNFSVNEFEHWDIYKLSTLFLEKLYNQNLFTTKVRRDALKRILIFLSLPDYDFKHLQFLLNDIFTEFLNLKRQNGRKTKLLFSSIGMLMRMLWNYSREEGNVYHSKYALNLCILKTWQFILSIRLNRDKRIIDLFTKLLLIQHEFYQLYFIETEKIAELKNGISCQTGFSFEGIAFPLKTYSYLDDIIYFFSLNTFLSDSTNLVNIQNNQKNEIIRIFDSNKDGGHKIILDAQLIPIHHIFCFFLKTLEIRRKDIEFLIKFLKIIIDQIFIRKKVKYSFPYNSRNLEKLIKYEASHIKDEGYPEGESLLIPMILEYLVIFNLKDDFRSFSDFTKDVDLQIAIPLWEEYPDFEERYFGGYLSEEYCIDLLDTPNDFKEFRDNAKSKFVKIDNFITNNIYPFLITLAQSFYQNEPDPNEWREWFSRINIRIE